MSDQPQEPFKESNLDARHRERLMRKLNTLIAVLVASAKVDRSINAPAADIDRLAKIRTNLTSTLEVPRAPALQRREALPVLPEPRRGRPYRG